MATPIGIAAAAQRLNALRAATASAPDEGLALAAVSSGVLTLVGLESAERVVARARDQGGNRDAALAALSNREFLLASLAQLEVDAFRDRLASDTESWLLLLDALRDSPLSRFADEVAWMHPEIAALAVPADRHAAVEHDSGTGRPLLDHLDRVLSRKLAGVECADRAVFQQDDALSADAFAREAARWKRLSAAGLAPCVRLALVHLDFAKGGTAAQRETWRSRFGVDLTVHNAAARAILERASPPGQDAPGVLSAFPELAAKPVLAGLVLALVESHGLTGQAVRGETPLAAFAPFVRWLRRDAPALAVALMRRTPEEVRALALDALHLVNVCDTAGVRERLLTDALVVEMFGVETRVADVAARGTSLEGIEAELTAADDAAWTRLFPDGEEARNRARLVDRLQRLRAGRLSSGEPPQLLESAVRALSPATVAKLVALLARVQLWYAEAATSSLSPDAQLKVIVLGLAAAVKRATDPGAMLHVSLLPLVDQLHSSAGRAAPYRVRVVEAMLAPLPVEALLDGAVPGGALGTLEIDLGGTHAAAVDFAESEEAGALFTLLAIYESKSSAAFHQTLKTLCDVYGLRKDEFDRLANEATYLEHMNSSRSDKERMLDWVKPAAPRGTPALASLADSEWQGRIVEVGPGGGVVLDLLEERFPESEVIGIDVSRLVVEALGTRKTKEKRRWSVVEADAFQLPAVLKDKKADTIVFCSVLHEIYSYLEPKFHLERVRDLLLASWRALAPGGRIVIRDGVQPPPGVRILRFVAPDARGFFDLFVKQFEGRQITFEPVPGHADRVRLSSADAMTFLYIYCWGPASFPYEIREQYGVLPYEEYKARMLGWLTGTGEAASAVALPAELASYLQPGYETGLAGKIELFDGNGKPARLPDSNALWVFEKR